MKVKNQVKLRGKLKTYMQWPLYIAILLVVMNLGLFCLDKKAGFLMAIFTLIYLIVCLVLVFRMRPEILNSVVDFAVGYGQIQKQMLLELDIPYGILDNQGKILWMNNAFVEVLGDDRGDGRLVYSVFPQIPKEVLPTGEGINAIDIKHNECDYRVELKRIDITELANNGNIIELEENTALIAMYMFDETQMNEYIQYIEDEKSVVGLLYIDNYDEALESVDDVKHSLLAGLVERRINQYFSSGECIVRKLEKDKFLVVTNCKHLRELEADKFSILDGVKDISIGNAKNVTISIGIGTLEDTFAKNSQLAKTAMDLALSRGGDQVVIKAKEDVRYYGGKSQQQEKNTRVKARVKAHLLREIIESKDKVIVMGHKLGDVDSFGASVGIFAITKVLNKQAYIVADNLTVSVKPLRDKLIADQEYADAIISGEQAKEIIDENTALVIVDVNRPSLTECPELLDKCKTKVVIDHHRQSSDVIDNVEMTYVEPYASSACEMVAEILQYIKDGIKLNATVADVFYAGMVIDTNNFTNRSGVRTFEAAAFLRRCGADTVRVRKLLRNDMRDYKARAEAISRAQILNGEYAIAICNAEGLESPTVVASQVANELLDINGIKASFVLTLYNDIIYVSARSIDELNVQVVMEKIGGGGHINMAGAQLVNCSMEEAVKLVRATLESMIENKEI